LCRVKWPAELRPTLWWWYGVSEIDASILKGEETERGNCGSTVGVILNASAL
ncbi:unnamed protein product, partial [Heterotrigona itama]